MPMLSTVLSFFLCLAQEPSSRWPQFRGVDGAGSIPASALPSSFELADAAWRVELPGTGKGSPAVWDGKVVLICSSGEQRRVVCLAAEDGTRRWVREYPFEAFELHKLNDYAASTPALDEHGVYVTWVNGGELEALALDYDGQELWRRSVGPYKSSFGGGRSPIVVDGVVVVANDNDAASALIGLDVKTGEIVWRRERTTGRASFATPALHRPREGDPLVLFASTAHGITCLRARDGMLMWELDDLFERRCVAMPALGGGYLFASSGRGGGGVESVVLALDDDGQTPRVRYRPRRRLPYVPSALFHGDYLFLWNDGGIVSCLDAASGETHWSERVEGEYYSSPIAVGERLFGVSRGGSLVCLAAGPQFELLGVTDLGEPATATPAVAQGALFLRTERHLLRVDGEQKD